jgi:hypothetical protein
MPLSIYQSSIPRFTHTLNSLSVILDKAVAHAEAKKIKPEALTTFRLYPDMLPFTSQIQIACDAAKGVVARLAGVEVPKHEDTEVTFADLKARIAKTIAFIESIKPAQIDGSEEKQITLKIGGSDMAFKGVDYLQAFALPNFYFHVATAYNILRHNGVEIGKRDFLGGQ